LEHPPENYPKPLVDLKVSHKAARERLWGLKGNTEVRADAQRILKIHT
jgi:deoxyribodipyrimidine photo-lyase